MDCPRRDAVQGRHLGVYRCYTETMPTKRRRHAITETPLVQRALDELRSELGTDDVEVAELVILGAKQKLAGLRAEARQQADLVAKLAERIRKRTPTANPALADEVRRSGWARG